ncbi:hypothetical protein SCHPADRAFT_947413 [Schizopora paradoxa]|uniref:Uncharacterized protein n=1 Tax=Schizopora paradoxa TaxID=27342 RepID=A0A0H2QZI5_9AGAM|nr:hypothetical protein SCHPADRAFT_947413 [Schizopora paradoxa]
MTTTMTSTNLSASRPSYSDEDIKLINDIRANPPSKKLANKHLVLGFMFNLEWAFQKSLQLYGGSDDTNGGLTLQYFNNIQKYRWYIMTESGISERLRVCNTPIIDRGGEIMRKSIIGIAENIKGRTKLPPPSGIRKLMELLETDEQPKWYVVDE